MSNGLDLVSPRVYEKLQEVLKELGIKNSYSLSIRPLSDDASNLTSCVVRVKVKHQNLHHFILKCGPRDELARSIFAVDKFFAREVYFYTKIFPEFEKLQVEKNVDGPVTFYPMFIDSLHEKYNKLVILEDVAPSGYKDKLQLETLDYDHVLVMLKEYAKLHALSFALRDQKKEIFKKLTLNVHDFHFTNYSKTLQRLNSTSCKKILALFQDDQYKNLYQSLAETYIDFPNIMDEVFEGELTSDHGVFTHTDCRLGNMLFKYHANGLVEKVCLVDWQVGTLASPAVDLVYAIFVNTDKVLRDKHYDDFINYYYDTFSTFLLKLGSDPELLFPLEILREHMKKYGVHTVLFCTVALYLVLLDLGQNFTHENHYYKRVKDIIVDCYNLGFLSNQTEP